MTYNGSKKAKQKIYVLRIIWFNLILPWLFNVKIDQRTIPMTLSLSYDGIINKSHVPTIELHIGVAPIMQYMHVRN